MAQWPNDEPLCGGHLFFFLGGGLATGFSISPLPRVLAVILYDCQLFFPHILPLYIFTQSQWERQRMKVTLTGAQDTFFRYVFFFTILMSINDLNSAKPTYGNDRSNRGGVRA